MFLVVTLMTVDAVGIVISVYHFDSKCCSKSTKLIDPNSTIKWSTEEDWNTLVSVVFELRDPKVVQQSDLGRNEATDSSKDSGNGYSIPLQVVEISFKIMLELNNHSQWSRLEP